MAAIQITQLTFAYEGSYDTIFENVSLQLDSDWKLGFVGRNGRGKTTFLKLLMGQYEHEGRISSPLAFEYFPYPVEDDAALTRDVVESVAPDVEDWRLYKELNQLEVADDVLYRPFSTLSGGEQTKVLLASLFLRQRNFLLIDEPTNHLDLRARHVVGDYLSRQKGFILVSHDRQFLDRCVDHILSINRADIQVQKGNYSSWAENKRRQDERELAENEKLKKEIGRLEKSARRTASWSDQVEKSKVGNVQSSYDGGSASIDRGFVGHKAAKMMQRSKSIAQRKQNAIEEKEQLLHNIEYEGKLKIFPLQDRRGKLVELDEVSLSFGDRQVLRGLSFSLQHGERLALEGANGSGKSSILRLVEGDLSPESGTIHLASGLVISTVPQESNFLRGDLRAYAKERDLDETLFLTILRKFGFARVQFEKDMSQFSAGQRKKVLLAASLSQSAHLYIWDEPLNYVDVVSRIQIENLITEFEPTMLLVEHDEAFLSAVATRKLTL